VNEKNALVSTKPATMPKKKRRRVRGSLIAQFAASDPVHLATAAELIRPYVDAIDLNCGMLELRNVTN